VTDHGGFFNYLLTLYTDGITEAENAQPDMFGLERLRKAIIQFRGLSSKEISAGILQEVRSFPGEHPQSDDIPLLVIRRL
jgi:sigma-B regulation protein RsbU (phosphoserine phosphatase)